MATTDLIGAPKCADHPGGTAPIPASAAVLLDGLLAEFRLVRAVAQYETAAEHRAQLASLAESGRMTDLDADSLAAAEDIMTAARHVLADAGRLDLIDDLHSKAGRYLALSALIDRLSSRESHYMTRADWRELYAAQEERASLYFELKRAGRLDVIGEAS